MTGMKTVLITGAAGFLASYIVRDLRNQGWRVVGVGRGVTKMDHILDAVYETSLPDPMLELAIRNEQPDLCIHAATPSSVPASVKNPTQDFQLAVFPWLQVLDVLRRYRPECRTILLSSASVYGQPGIMPISEKTPPAPISPYGFHRHYCELMQNQYRQLYDLQGTSLRIFSAYGVGLRRQVVWDICHKALTKSKDHILFGTGRETRDFVHASDVAQAVSLLAKTDDWKTIYNLASGIEVSIIELMGMILEWIPGSKALNFDGKVSIGTPIRWQADINCLKELGYSPTRTLQEGVKEVVEACMQECDAS